MSPEQWVPATWGDAQAGDYVKVNGVEFYVTEVDHPRIACKLSGSTAPAKVGTPPLDKAIELKPMNRETAFASVSAVGNAVTMTETATLPDKMDETDRQIKAGCCGGFRAPDGAREMCDPCPDPLTAADAQREEVRAAADAQFAELKAMRERAPAPTAIICGPVAPGAGDLAVVEQFKTDLPALKALRPLLTMAEQLAPAILAAGAALAGASREVTDSYAAALRELGRAIEQGQALLPEPTPGDMAEERAAYKVIEANGLQPKVIDRVLALKEITKHLTDMHADVEVTERGALTGIEYRSYLHDLHFDAHKKDQPVSRTWSERGTVPHTHAVMDRPMR